MIIGEIFVGVGSRHRAGGEPAEDRVHQHRRNSDALRGASCNPYMFHIEGANSMYVMAVGSICCAENLVKGKKWYSLTAELRFRPRPAEGGQEIHGGERRPVRRRRDGADHATTSRLLLKIPPGETRSRGVEPGGNQITNFLKQYTEYGLSFRWPASASTPWSPGAPARATSPASGRWCGITRETPSSKKYVDAFQKKYGKLPENPVLGRLQSLKIVAQSMNEISNRPIRRSSPSICAGREFDVLKARESISVPTTTRW